MLNPFLYYLLLFKAYNLLPAQQAQTLNYTWAITLSLLAVPFLGQKLRRRDGVAIVLGYFGALVIATRGDVFGLQFDSPLGVTLALVSTLIWAGYWILNTRNQGDPIVSLLLGFLISLPFIVVATWLLADFAMTAWQGWLGAIYVGLFEMGFGFVLWLMALRHATNTAPISNLIFISPFASLVLLNLLIGEEHPPRHPHRVGADRRRPADPATQIRQALPQDGRATSLTMQKGASTDAPFVQSIHSSGWCLGSRISTSKPPSSERPSLMVPWCWDTILATDGQPQATAAAGARHITLGKGLEHPGSSLLRDPGAIVREPSRTQ